MAAPARPCATVSPCLSATAPPGVARPSLVDTKSITEASGVDPCFPESLLSDRLDRDAPALDPDDPDQCPRHPWWHWTNTTTGERRPFECHSWACPYCSPRKAARWSRLIAAAPVARHLVFTRLASDFRPAAARLKAIIKALRRGEASPRAQDGSRIPQTFEYFATSERHSRAGIHTHLLQWGSYFNQRSLSALLDRYGAGRVCWIERIDDIDQPARATALSRYVTRHLVSVNHPFQPKAKRRVTYSRHFWLGRSAAQVAAELWPRPDPPETWLLSRPDVDYYRELHRDNSRDWHSDPAHLHWYEDLMAERDQALADKAAAHLPF